jgi:hypothetical protein
MAIALWITVGWVLGMLSMAGIGWLVCYLMEPKVGRID